MEPHKALRKLIAETEPQIIIDNEFEHAYNIPIDRFKEFDKTDLIELIYVIVAIAEENQLSIREILTDV